MKGAQQILLFLFVLSFIAFLSLGIHFSFTTTTTTTFLEEFEDESSTGMEIDWKCQFDFGGYYYDLEPMNENATDERGLYHTMSYGYQIFFKLCSDTTYIPSYDGYCYDYTQCCMSDPYGTLKSDGIYPTTYEAFPGGGVIMRSRNGYRNTRTNLYVLCPTESHKSGSYGENSYIKEEGVWNITVYLDVGCPYSPVPPPSPIVSPSPSPSLTPSPSPTPTPTISPMIGLRNFYYSTNGPQWLNNSNWLSPFDPTGCSWYGLKCNDQKQVVEMRLYQNRLLGTINEDFSSISTLKNIYFQNNSLTGYLPKYLQTLPLQYMFLTNNSFFGSFPEELTQIPTLKELNLQFNNFYGTVPEEICGINYFDIQNNSWTCPLPSCCKPYSGVACGTCSW